MTRAKEVIKVIKDESYCKVKTQAASFVSSTYDLQLNIPALAKTMSYFYVTPPSKVKYQAMKARRGVEV